MHDLTRGANTKVEVPKENPVCHIWHDGVLDAGLKAMKSSPRIHMEGRLADSVGRMKFLRPDSGNKIGFDFLANDRRIELSMVKLHVLALSTKPFRLD